MDKQTHQPTNQQKRNNLERMMVGRKRGNEDTRKEGRKDRNEGRKKNRKEGTKDRGKKGTKKVRGKEGKREGRREGWMEGGREGIGRQGGREKMKWQSYMSRKSYGFYYFVS